MFKAENLTTVSCARHGFFTREGGVSEGPYRSLNCGYGSDDNRDRVSENRRRVLAGLGVPDARLVTAYQVHSARTVIVDDGWDLENAPRADAMVTASPGVALGILTADCAPVLFCDGRAGVVGAAHAGWKGARNGILESCVKEMCRLGANADRIVAAVGPCIGQDSYETGPEFFQDFVSENRDNERFFVPSGRDGHYLFDLEGYAVMRLKALGLDSVVGLGLDTLSDEQRFFSYRRGTLAGVTEYGRLISAIVLED